VKNDFGRRLLKAILDGFGDKSLGLLSNCAATFVYSLALIKHWNYLKGHKSSQKATISAQRF